MKKVGRRMSTRMSLAAAQLFIPTAAHEVPSDHEKASQLKVEVDELRRRASVSQPTIDGKQRRHSKLKKRESELVALQERLGEGPSQEMGEPVQEIEVERTETLSAPPQAKESPPPRIMPQRRASKLFTGLGASTASLGTSAKGTLFGGVGTGSESRKAEAGASAKGTLFGAAATVNENDTAAAEGAYSNAMPDKSNTTPVRKPPRASGVGRRLSMLFTHQPALGKESEPREKTKEEKDREREDAKMAKLQEKIAALQAKAAIPEVPEGDEDVDDEDGQSFPNRHTHTQSRKLNAARASIVIENEIRAGQQWDGFQKLGSIQDETETVEETIKEVQEAEQLKEVQKMDRHKKKRASKSPGASTGKSGSGRRATHRTGGSLKRSNSSKLAQNNALEMDESKQETEPQPSRKERLAAATEASNAPPDASKGRKKKGSLLQVPKELFEHLETVNDFAEGKALMAENKRGQDMGSWVKVRQKDGKKVLNDGASRRSKARRTPQAIQDDADDVDSTTSSRRQGRTRRRRSRRGRQKKSRSAEENPFAQAKVLYTFGELHPIENSIRVDGLYYVAFPEDMHLILSTVGVQIAEAASGDIVSGCAWPWQEITEVAGKITSEDLMDCEELMIMVNTTELSFECGCSAANVVNAAGKYILQ